MENNSAPVRADDALGNGGSAEDCYFDSGHIIPAHRRNNSGTARWHLLDVLGRFFQSFGRTSRIVHRFFQLLAKIGTGLVASSYAAFGIRHPAIQTCRIHHCSVVRDFGISGAFLVYWAFFFSRRGTFAASHRTATVRHGGAGRKYSGDAPPWCVLRKEGRGFPELPVGTAVVQACRVIGRWAGNGGYWPTLRTWAGRAAELLDGPYLVSSGSQGWLRPRDVSSW